MLSLRSNGLNIFRNTRGAIGENEEEMPMAECEGKGRKIKGRLPECWNTWQKTRVDE